MQAKSTDKKTFQLTHNEQLLGELVYENLFFLKAQINLIHSDTYVITPAGFFKTSISVTHNGTPIATLVMNWRGQIVFTFQDGREFVLKLNGLFNNKYIIENKEGEKLIQFDPKFNWRTFHYSYEISYDIAQDNRNPDTLLLLLGVYACNYFMAAMSGSM